MIRKSISVFICIAMILSVAAISLSAADTYWTARAAYVEAKDSGNREDLVAAVKRIEAVYSNPTTVMEHERLYMPRLDAAKAYEAMGQFDKAAEYYRRALNNIEQIRALEKSDRYYDYLKTLPELIRHNEKVPTVYAETTDTSNIPYYGAIAEQTAGTYQGMCLTENIYYDEDFHSAQLLYVQFFSEDIKSFAWTLPEDNDDYLLLIGWNIPNENKADLDKINSGKYDEYIIRNLKYLSTLNCNVLIRFGAEVDCWPSLPTLSGSDKSAAKEFINSYKSAFRRIATLADKHSPNAGMVYSPNGISNWYYTVEDFYPGDEYVDWVGISAYYNKTSGDSWKLSNGADAYYSRGDYYDNPIIKIEHIVEAFGEKKPIIITEGGCAYKSSNGVQTVEYATEILSYFYTYVSRVYPQIKGVMYFNHNINGTNYKIIGDSGVNESIASLYKKLVRSNVSMEYMLGNTDICGYTEITNINEVTDSLNLSVYAPFPSTATTKVTYTLDGTSTRSYTKYPYEYKLSIDDLSVGKHSLTVTTTCKKTTYNLYYEINVAKNGKVTVTKATSNGVSHKHTYTNDCDTTCNECKEARTAPHSYKTTTTKATTSANGKIVKKCTACGDVSSTKTVYKIASVKFKKATTTYSGSVKKPTVVVTDSKGNEISSAYYTVTYPSGMKKAGTYKVKVTFKGRYSGTKTLTYTIKPVDVSELSVKFKKATTTYDGTVKKPSVVVKDANGNTISSSNYTIKYPSGMKKVGTYKVKVIFKGNYSGTKTLTYKINPAPTTVSGLTAYKKSITVKIDKEAPQVTGYQIRYSKSKSFTNAKTITIKSYNTTKYTVKSLARSTKYYFEVRTYKSVDGVRYYSGWSTYKYTKTK